MYTKILGLLFIIYTSHSIWTMTQLFRDLNCSAVPCYKYVLGKKPQMQLALFTSVPRNPIAAEVTQILNIKNFNYHEPFVKDIQLNVPLKTRSNGTLHLQVVFAPDNLFINWKTLQRESPTVIHTVRLTEYLSPRIEGFNLLSKVSPEVKKSETKPTVTSSSAVKHETYIKSKVCLRIMTDIISISQEDAPLELANLININRYGEILPIITNDFFSSRVSSYKKVKKNATKFNLSLEYKPIGIGKLRFMLLIEQATKTLHEFGFSSKDVDDIKGMFSDTNLYLLCVTLLVGSIHLLFDLLSFKNDISFWRKKKSYEGLSKRTTLWRAFCQSVIFLYLWDENTSYLILIPSGIAACIELWKCKKILKLDISIQGIKKTNSYINPTAEQNTDNFDRQAMRYLSFFLYPLCLLGALFSLMYQSHKSWYSWMLNSLVNGVYAFDFLFMLPQLFVNYKLKSVQALPWRSFMYKAFNTFIDDLFAFIVSMPTSHRVACFRDDLVFFIYIYQRWLYAVDISRKDDCFENEFKKSTKIKNQDEKDKKHN